MGGADWLGGALKPGKHTLVFDFKYDGPGFGKGGTGVLSVDGKELSRQKIEHTIPFLMAIDESFDIGSDTRTGVDDSYKLPFRFNGTDQQADLQARTGAVDGGGSRGNEEGTRGGARLTVSQFAMGGHSSVSDARSPTLMIDLQSAATNT